MNSVLTAFQLLSEVSGFFSKKFNFTRSTVETSTEDEETNIKAKSGKRKDEKANQSVDLDIADSKRNLRRFKNI